MLSEPEAKAVLGAYDIPVVETRTAKDIDEAVKVADEIGYPVALKILSHDITHKSDVGGVLLNIESDKLLQYAAEGMLSRIQRLQPAARIEGFSVQQMSNRPNAHELIIGVTTDNIFGPVVLFGKGGTAVEVVNDKAVALPPLNMALAEELMARTNIYRELQGYRNTAAADLEAVRLTLLKVSQIIIDHPEIQELDINPLFADSKGVLALDARIKVARTDKTRATHLAIRPYPQELEEWVTTNSGRRILLRPIKPEDELAHHELFKRLSPHDVYFRFFRAVGDIQHDQLARYTQIDYDREMAFIATTGDHDKQAETLGVVRAVSDANNHEAEFAIVIASDFQGNRLGSILMEKLIRYCRARGTRRLVGQTFTDNTKMRRLAETFGFEMHYSGDGTVHLSLDLQTEELPRAVASS